MQCLKRQGFIANTDIDLFEHPVHSVFSSNKILRLIKNFAFNIRVIRALIYNISTIYAYYLYQILKHK